MRADKLRPGLHSTPQIKARVALICAVGPVALFAAEGGGMKYTYVEKSGKLTAAVYRKGDVLYDLRYGRLEVDNWKRARGAFQRRHACRQCAACVRKLRRTEVDDQACGKCSPCCTQNRRSCKLLLCERL
jgi:hypothetical protein